MRRLRAHTQRTHIAAMRFAAQRERKNGSVSAPGGGEKRIVEMLCSSVRVTARSTKTVSSDSARRPTTGHDRTSTLATNMQGDDVATATSWSQDK